jgi:hypothetical protein
MLNRVSPVSALNVVEANAVAEWVVSGGALRCASAFMRGQVSGACVNPQKYSMRRNAPTAMTLGVQCVTAALRDELQRIACR